MIYAKLLLSLSFKYLQIYTIDNKHAKKILIFNKEVLVMNTIIETDNNQNIRLVNLDDTILFRENKAKIQEKIEQFNQKFLKAIRKLKDMAADFDYESYEYSVAELSDKVENNLIIKDEQKLKQTLASIAMSDILLDEGIEQKDPECLTAALSGLIFDLNNLEIFTKI